MPSRTPMLINVACLVFPFLLWPTLLTCSSCASVTATSLSFLEVFGLPTLFSLNYLAYWYQESSQVWWRACHAWLGFRTLSLCLLHLSLLLVAFSMRRTLSVPVPQGGVRYRETLKHVRPSCVRTPSVWDWSSNLGKDGDCDVTDVNSAPDESAKESSYFHVHGSHL